MNTYLESLQGQIHQYHKRKYRKMYISIKAVPKSKKGIKKADEIYFQNEILRYLIEFGRRSYRSSVVMELDFYSFQDDPPAIHTLAKCYLDLLENNKNTKNDRRKKLIYRNDRQVKALFINYHLSNKDNNEIHIKVDSYTNFYKDLMLYRKICKNEFYEIDLRNFLEDYEDKRKDDILVKENAIEDYYNFMMNKNNFCSNCEEKIYDSWLQMYKREAQKEHLRDIDLSLEELALIVDNKYEITDLKLKDMSNSIKNSLLHPWFSIDLGNIPEKEGDNIIFKTYVKNKVEEMLLERKDFLIPLYVQLCVTIILVKPKNGGIDLDNLARKIIPFVNEILKPPSRFISKEEIDKLTDSKIKEHLLQDYDKRRRIPKYSITRYQIFEVPSISDDEGNVSLYLGDGCDSINIWDQLEDFIHKWYEYVM